MSMKRALTFFGIEIITSTPYQSHCTNAMCLDRIANMLIARCASHERQNINARGAEIRAFTMKLVVAEWRSVNVHAHVLIW